MTTNARAASPDDAAPRGAILPLGAMRPGQRGRVARLIDDDPRRLRKLLALGVLPGAPIELRRRAPAVVFRIGYSQLAVDAGLADGILVHLD